MVVNNIQPVSYKQYKKSFLSKVVLSLLFDPSQISNDDLIARFNKFAHSAFNVPVDKWEQGSALRISNKDNSIAFYFAYDGAIVELDGEKYQNFTNSQLPQLVKLVAFVKDVLSLSHIDTISIRKLNAWDFSSSNDKNPSIEWVYEKIFSEALRNVLSTSNLTEQESKIRFFKKWQTEYNGCEVLIKSAYIQNTEDVGNTRLLLDTECSCNVNKIEIDDVTSQCQDVNKYLFDIFHWCVTSEVLELMEK